jgi:hypothetical protein
LITKVDYQNMIDCMFNWFKPRGPAVTIQWQDGGTSTNHLEDYTITWWEGERIY